MRLCSSGMLLNICYDDHFLLAFLMSSSVTVWSIVTFSPEAVPALDDSCACFKADFLRPLPSDLSSCSMMTSASSDARVAPS